MDITQQSKQLRLYFTGTLEAPLPVSSEMSIAADYSKRLTEQQQLLEMISRDCGLSIYQVILRLNNYTRGWWAYYHRTETRSFLRSLNGWIIRRLRAILWHQWKNRRTRIRELKKRGIRHQDAVRAGCSRKGPWRMSRVKWVIMALPNAYFKSLGLYLLS